MKLIFLIALYAINEASKSTSNDGGNSPEMQRSENERKKFQEDLPADKDSSVRRQQISPCGTNPCRHGTCHNKGSDYSCICESGYKGRICDTACLEGDGSSYRGNKAITVSGLSCQNWASKTPHVPDSCCNPDKVQELKSHNHCRNPDGEEDRPWCYTMDKNKRWEYCKIPYCSDEDASGIPNVHCFLKHGEDYSGRRSRTHSGRQCQSWVNPSTRKKTWLDDEGFKELVGEKNRKKNVARIWRFLDYVVHSNNLESNYCRNPNGANEPWCYTREKEWEYCGVPRCIEQGWIDAGMEWCDKDWRASDEKTCGDYLEKSFCKRGSERGGMSHYGTGWKIEWGTFDKWASHTEYGPGRSALVCPQCGCGSIWLPELQVCRDALNYRICYAQNMHGPRKCADTDKFCESKCTPAECDTVSFRCSWPDYPCAGTGMDGWMEGGYGRSFGCKEGKCWRQCGDGKWCYVSNTEGECKRDSDCAALDKQAWLQKCVSKCQSDAVCDNYYKEYPCGNGWHYGCENGYCWSQCSLGIVQYNWCWVEDENDNWVNCETNEDCTLQQAYRSSCGGPCDAGRANAAL